MFGCALLPRLGAHEVGWAPPAVRLPGLLSVEALPVLTLLRFYSGAFLKAPCVAWFITSTRLARPLSQGVNTDIVLCI